MTQAQATPTFEMTVDLNVLEHFGINLYSDIAAVLIKAVASHILHYDRLIRGVQEAYSGYIDQAKVLGKLANTVNMI